MHLKSRKRTPHWEDWGFTPLSWWVLQNVHSGRARTRAHLTGQIITPACISAASAWGPVERRVGGPLTKQRAEGKQGPYGVSRTTEVFNPVVTCSPRPKNKACTDSLTCFHIWADACRRGRPFSTCTRNQAIKMHEWRRRVRGKKKNINEYEGTMKLRFSCYSLTWYHPTRVCINRHHQVETWLDFIDKLPIPK